MCDFAAGGKALVTVWAEEQSDAKKLAKWQRIKGPCPEAGCTDIQMAASAGDQPPVSCPEPAAAVTSSVSGSDYLVPWHVPSHRPETAAFLAAAAQDAHATGGSHASVGISGSDASRVTSGAINAQKGTIVFQRYYHLFCQGELEQLASQLPQVNSVTTYYDKDNWCLIMKKQT